MKRILSVILCAILLLGVAIPVYAVNAEDSTTETTAPSESVPETTAPASADETTENTTVPETTVPETTVPETTEEKKCTCGSVDGTHTAECALSRQPEETIANDEPTTDEKQCSCGNVDGTHTEECPLYVEPDASFYDRLLATTTLEEFDSVMLSATDEEFFGMTDEQYYNVDAHFVELGGTPKDVFTVSSRSSAVNFTNVAPLTGTD